MKNKDREREGEAVGGAKDGVVAVGKLALRPKLHCIYTAQRLNKMVLLNCQLAYLFDSNLAVKRGRLVAL